VARHRKAAARTAIFLKAFAKIRGKKQATRTRIRNKFSLSIKKEKE